VVEVTQESSQMELDIFTCSAEVVMDSSEEEVRSRVLQLIGLNLSK
jgi:hypothetical protein